MLARLLRLILIFELFGYFLVGVYLQKLAAWTAGTVLLLMILLALAWRGWLIVVTYLYANAHQTQPDPEDHLDLTRWLHEALREIGAFVALTFIEPFEKILLRSDQPRKPAAGQAPLLLIHDYWCNRGFWWWIKPRLEAHGRSVGTLNLEPLGVSIDSYAEPIARRVAALCRETGASRVTLVGHGMGGLACVAYLRRYGEELVDRLVTIATPHQGSVLACNGIGRNAREMEASSVWLKELAASPVTIPCINFYSLHDNFVVPQVGSIRPGADNRALSSVGHLAMSVSPVLLNELLAATATDKAGVAFKQKQETSS